MPRSYEEHKERARRRSAEKSRSGREIGQIPAPVNPIRRESCRLDFRLFCLTYLSQIFTLPFSGDHLKVIAKIQRAVLEGGLFAEAMPRGSGKTTLLEAAALWASSYGHHRFVVFIGAELESAKERLEFVHQILDDPDQTEDEEGRPVFNPQDAFGQDFPEICKPIRALGGTARRAKGQLCNGRLTQIRLSSTTIVFPTIPGSPSSGAIFRVAGITGRIRGMKYTTLSRESLRPSLVIVDDPQTEESAASPQQCDTRERTIARAILGLGGPDRGITAMMACTVIRKGDVADRILDHKLHPQWRAERMKMLYTLPKNLALWDAYQECLLKSIEEHGDIRDATEFYRANREAMDEGSEIAWPERIVIPEMPGMAEYRAISGVQCAMTIRALAPETFAAEYQNEPVDESIANELPTLTSAQVAAKLNGIPRGTASPDIERVTSFIDVQDSALYWIVAGWSNGFTGYVLDYGVFPKQSQGYFASRDASPTLMEWARKSGTPGGIESAWYAGLDELTRLLFSREFERQGGGVRRLDMCFIDSGYGTSSETVYRICRQSTYAASLRPSKGYAVKPGGRPMDKWPDNPKGTKWIERDSARRGTRHVLYDTNFWKTFVHDRLAVPMGDPGCLSLFGDKAYIHRMLADHIVSERRERLRAESTGTVSDVWTLRPGMSENHFLDGLVGAAAAANFCGIGLYGDARAKKTVRMSDIQKRRRGGR